MSYERKHKEDNVPYFKPLTLQVKFGENLPHYKAETPMWHSKPSVPQTERERNMDKENETSFKAFLNEKCSWLRPWQQKNATWNAVLIAACLLLKIRM